MIRRLLLLSALAAALSAIVGASPAGSTGGASYEWFACETPCVSQSGNGATVELQGEGTLTIHSKSVSGEGEFSYGGVSGTFEATQLLSFVSYGSVPGPCPPECEGGRALIRVHLSNGSDATLTVTCLIGNPPGGADEGIRLAVQGGPNFNREVSGETLFFRTG
jgi:hypothetical protein